jgi:hypothetical protein
MAHRHHKVLPDEDVNLTKVDLLGGIKVARRLEDHEEGVAVAFVLGRWWATTASSTASSRSPNSSATAWNSFSAG